MIKNFEEFINEHVNYKKKDNIVDSIAKTEGTILVIGSPDKCKHFIYMFDNAVLDRFDILASYNLDLETYNIKDSSDFDRVLKHIMESERAILFVNSKNMDDVITVPVIDRFDYVINLGD